MTRHIVDTSHDAAAKSRAKKFVKIEREAAPTLASRTLQKRPKHQSGSGRMREFLRIERGVRA